MMCSAHGGGECSAQSKARALQTVFSIKSFLCSKYWFSSGFSCQCGDPLIQEVEI